MHPEARKHFNHPSNRGELGGAHGSGKAGEPGCGAEIGLQIRFDGQRVAEAAFTATGSAEVIAAGSMLTSRITGLPWREAAAVSVTALLGQLTGTEKTPGEGESGPARAIQAADFAIEALHTALEDSIRNDSFPRVAQIDPDAVLVAMSGGVDSSVACLLMQREGGLVTGVTMRLWSEDEQEGTPDPEDSPSCCSPQAIRDARATCHQLGLPHLTVDYRERFEREVVDYFTTEYLDGRTPNPCTRCNGVFRFPQLVGLADRIGAARVATGHYAQVTGSGHGAQLSRGADPGKDQSYMLWAVEPGLLARLVFPLAAMKKQETRQIAQEAGFSTHARPESQEVCFIPDNDYRRFIRGRVSDLPGAGKIVGAGGEELGRHSGYLDFTVGQRHGLGVSAPEPLYVLKTMPGENVVVAGTHERLAVRQLTINNICSHMTEDEMELVLHGRAANRSTPLKVQVRYNSPPVSCHVAKSSDQKWDISLEEPVFGVAPGQSAVLYLGDRVLAGGIIAGT